MQIVYITNRPQIFNETLLQVLQFIDFVESAIVVCPESCCNEIIHTDRIHIDILIEDDLIGNVTHEFTKADHQSRNYLLRAKLVDCPLVQDEFIMSDDDSRPITDIKLVHYKLRGKYRSYYFYDLSRWKYVSTDFDHGQRVTGAILRYLDLPVLSYASHMPQIINKKIYAESVRFFEKYAMKYPLDEWSTYFNFAHKYFVSSFCAPEAFRTLCWPDYPGTWPYYIRPSRYLFENYYPHMYSVDALFEGLSPCPKREEIAQETIEKIIRLDNIESGRMKFRLSAQDPWRRKSLKHAIASRIGHAVKKTLDVLLLEERTSLLAVQKWMEETIASSPDSKPDSKEIPKR